MLTHRNLVYNAQLCSAHFELGPQSRIFGVAPLFHVTGFELQMLGAFAAGAAQVLTYRFQPAVVLDAFLEHRPTFIIGAITAFIALMNQPEATRAHFASFDRLYSGGAPIAPAVVEAFAQRFGRSIRSSYGMTELTAPSHLAPAKGPIPVDPQSGALSVGIPTPGTDVIVVDDVRRPLGPGEHGEVVVRGPAVMAGYWRKPVETGEVLVGGWMHTGDIGFFDETGWFYLVDRKKDMISASGFKVWPREVEDVLYAFPGVREAAVTGAPDAYRGETVIAFVSAEAGAVLDVTALVQFCRERLAAYKCPVRIDVLPELPKTATGKITRNTLKQGLRP
jgi:long-chain acyl-CoA synthetase